MIIIKVELHSAINGSITELARMKICNDGQSENPNFGNYIAQTFIGRSTEQLSKEREAKHITIQHWPRQRLHVWNLVCKALRQMGYVDGFER